MIALSRNEKAYIPGENETKLYTLKINNEEQVPKEMFYISQELEDWDLNDYMNNPSEAKDFFNRIKLDSSPAY
jgi:hypothetical protein